MMLCKHYRIKYKMVSWATDSSYGHEQGFNTNVRCCADCGKVMPKNPKEKLNEISK